MVEELHRELDDAVGGSRRCCAVACVLAEFARDGVDLVVSNMLSSSRGVERFASLLAFDRGYVVALALYGGVDSPFLEVDDDLEVGVVDGVRRCAYLLEFAGRVDRRPVRACRLGRIDAVEVASAF